MEKGTKIALQLIVLIAAILLGAAIGQAQNESSDEVVDVYRQALELNEGRFDDVNLILIGDTVLFPSRDGSGVEAWVANEPSEGQHDSFWRLSQKYVAGEIETIPADTIRVVINTPTNLTVEDEEEDSDSSLTWILIVGGILLAAIIIYAMYKTQDISRNPDHYQAVGGNIDEVTREETLSTIFSKYLRPGDKLINFWTGVLKNSEKKKRLKVQMQFGDSKVRTVWINAGERVSKAIIVDDKKVRRVLYLRNACANGFSNGSFSELPGDWYIDYDSSWEEGLVEVKEEDGVKFIIQKPLPVKDVGVESKPKSHLSELTEIIKALNLNGDNLEVSFSEKPDELELTLKVKGQNKEEGVF